MESVLISTDQDRHARERDLHSLDEHEERERAQARKNKGFTQIYPKGWKKAVELAKENPRAFELYAFFAEHIDPSCGAVVCDQKFLADQFEVSTRTIQRWLKFLESKDSLIKIPVSGRVYAYALDPFEVWKGFDNSKKYAAFVTKTLMNNDEYIKRKLMSMFKGNKEKQT